ncbi:MAG TPA: nucleotidyltransferase domain-containing protein, partial [Thermoanaerobaculia bacterium]|nr:nucleotidyltransferase domain-containing protein [Thermoanaerobaculia bacterium]
AAVYGERLVSVVVFGSVGRRAMRADSDVDLLLVAATLPDGRLARVQEFDGVEHALAGELEAARRSGVATRLSPILKTPEEVSAGSPLFLDMIDDGRLLVDRDGFFATILAGLEERLDRLGARKLRRGGGWVWDLKPSFRPGDVVEL